MHIFGGGRGAGAGGAGAGAAASTVPTVDERGLQDALSSEIPVLVELSTARTSPPDVGAFAKEMEGKIRVVRVDVEKSPRIAQQLRIQQVPTFMLIVDGRPTDMQVGAMTAKELRAMVEPFLPRQEGALKARELAELLKQHAVAPVDVRDAAAFGRAHLPGAASLPAEEIETRLAELFMLPGQPVLYDRAGEKAKDLAEKLAAQGNPVAFLEGGILAWESEGLPVERP